MEVSVAHTPDADDAFMFWALATGKIDTEDRRYVHELADIETLNRRAFAGELEVTAVSLHAYAYLAERYALLDHGASVGDGYGPRLVGRGAAPPDPQAAVAGRTVAVPGELTTACLALRLYQPALRRVVLPFDRIEDAVAAGEVELGLLIHEGQLTFGAWGLKKVVDLGRWWHDETGLPIPLGLDVVRKSLGRAAAVALAIGHRARVAGSVAIIAVCVVILSPGTIARGEPNPVMAGATLKAEQAALHQTVGFDALIAIEKATVEK